MLEARSVDSVPQTSPCVYDLVELCDRLEARGASVSVGADENLIALYTRLGASAPMVIKWTPNIRLVQITQSLPIRVDGAAAVGPAAIAVAVANGWLGVPALALDVDERVIDYRTRLFTENDGGLDVELVCQVVDAVVAEVERVAPYLAQRLRADEDEGVAAPFAGYVD
jgi:hypothetical protein